MLLFTANVTLITITPNAVVFVQLRLDAVAIGDEIIVLDIVTTRFDIVELREVIECNVYTAPALEVAA